MDSDLILYLAQPIIKAFEGLRLSPYLCSAGVPTIGYGSTYYETGVRVKLTDPAIDEEYATALLLGSIKATYLPSMIAACPGLETEGQAAAILSWTYNLGVGNLRASTLRRKINAQDWEGAGQEILKWNKAAGKVSRGLTVRRRAEAKLFLDNSPK